MDTTHEDHRSDLRAIAGLLRRRAGLVLVAVLAALAAAILLSAGQHKQYQSTAVLLFRPVLLDVQVTGVPLQVPSGDPQREAATDVGLVAQERVRAGAAQMLGPGYSAQSLSNRVEISSQGKSDLVAVKGTAPTPADAARIANAIANEYILLAGQEIVREVTAAEDHVRSQLTQPGLAPSQQAALRAAVTKLSVLASLGPGNVHLEQPALPPSSPSSPKPVRNAVIGGIIGVVIGLALAFAIEQFDDRLRRPEDIEALLGLPLLATIPKSRQLRRGKQRNERLGNEAEAFRLLDSNLRYRTAEREIRSVLVTSAAPGAGKTTIAMHLAAAA